MLLSLACFKNMLKTWFSMTKLRKYFDKTQNKTFTFPIFA